MTDALQYARATDGWSAYSPRFSHLFDGWRWSVVGCDVDLVAVQSSGASGDITVSFPWGGSILVLPGGDLSPGSPSFAFGCGPVALPMLSSSDAGTTALQYGISVAIPYSESSSLFSPHLIGITSVATLAGTGITAGMFDSLLTACSIIQLGPSSALISMGAMKVVGRLDWETSSPVGSWWGESDIDTTWRIESDTAATWQKE